MNKIYYKDKEYIGTGSINNILLVGNKTSANINVVDMTEPMLNLDSYQIAGSIDKEIYDALVALDWTDCIV